MNSLSLPLFNFTLVTLTFNKTVTGFLGAPLNLWLSALSSNELLMIFDCLPKYTHLNQSTTKQPPSPTQPPCPSVHHHPPPIHESSSHFRRSVRQSRGMRKTRDTRRFVCYSIYAWGIPAILTTFVHLVDKYTLLHSDYLPNMGKRSCWFASEFHPINY